MGWGRFRFRGIRGEKAGQAAPEPNDFSGQASHDAHVRAEFLTCLLAALNAH